MQRSRMSGTKKLEIIFKGERGSGRSTMLNTFATLLEAMGVGHAIVKVDPAGRFANADEVPEDGDTHLIELWDSV